MKYKFIYRFYVHISVYLLYIFHFPFYYHSNNLFIIDKPVALLLSPVNSSQILDLKRKDSYILKVY